MKHRNRRYINVLWVVDHLGFKGKIHGAGRYYLNVIPSFDDCKYRVFLCVLRAKDKLHRIAETAGAKNVIYLDRKKFDFLSIFDIVRIILVKKIDILHLHGYGSSNFGILAGLLTRTPSIVHHHDPAKYYPWFQKLADLTLGKCASLSIAVSNSVKEICIKKKRLRPEKIRVLATCIKKQEFQPVTLKDKLQFKKDLGITTNCTVVGTITRLFEQKGNQYFIRAANEVVKSYPKTVFLIVGDGPLRGELEELVLSLGLEDTVRFMGHQTNIHTFLSIFDIKILPSLWEGTPLSMIEAMAMRKAIVATNVDGIADVLKDQETALLVPPGDYFSLAKKIIYLIENPRIKTSLALRAYEESNKYSTLQTAKRFGEIYSLLLNFQPLNFCQSHANFIDRKIYRK